MSANRVFVGGLSNEVVEQDIKEFFAGYGVITKTMLKTGYCFLDFRDGKDADDACHDLNDQLLFDKKVVVQRAKGTDHTENRAPRYADEGYRQPQSRGGRGGYRGGGRGGGYQRGGGYGGGAGRGYSGDRGDYGTEQRAGGGGDYRDDRRVSGGGYRDTGEERPREPRRIVYKDEHDDRDGRDGRDSGYEIGGGYRDRSDHRDGYRGDRGGRDDGGSYRGSRGGSSAYDGGRGRSRGRGGYRDEGYVGYSNRGGGGRDFDSSRGRQNFRVGGRGAGRPHGTVGPKWEMRVDNLSSRISWQELKDYLRELKFDVTFAEAHTKQKNTATVCFATKSHMEEAAKKICGTDLGGKNNQRKVKAVQMNKGISRSKTRSRSLSARKSRSQSVGDNKSVSRSKSKSRSVSPASN